MKYLYFDDNTYPCEYNEEMISIFLTRYDKYLEEFEKISDCFPKRFLKEYKKRYFHDYNIYSIELLHIKRGFELYLTIINENNEKIQIIYHNVKFFSTQLNWNYYNDILYAEILKYDDNHFSQELSISSNESLFIVFKSLSFHKMKKNT